MDLVNTAAQADLRPARKASQGIAAAVLTCLPLRRRRSEELQMRCGWEPGHAAGLWVGQNAEEARGGSPWLGDRLRKTWRVNKGTAGAPGMGGTREAGLGAAGSVLSKGRGWGRGGGP
ncbi:hypothetical protein NDU88_003340 [Pleurodeles waltl]|uniref:Uncharacterized protein n=1 Tax=Pleurodeles waltl TaxID=8319 RepID=A0AAV7UY62_PLEWA|nr:hypothetical protein NDU88_003340 [Pleurodeles waltl]